MYDKPENAVLSLSRRERVLLDPLGASKKSDNKKKKEPSESEIMQADLEPVSYTHLTLPTILLV